MVKGSVTLLQRDANDGSPRAEAGQASCDCSTEPPGRRKCEDQGQEDESGTEGRRFPKQIQRPLEKTSTCMCPPASQDPSAGGRAEEPAQLMHGQQPSTGQPWAARSMSISAWELLNKGFHGSYLLRALLIFRKVCSHLLIQASANTLGAVIILTMHRLKTCKDGYFKGKKDKKGTSFLLHLLALVPSAHLSRSGTVLPGRVSNRCSSLPNLIFAQHVDPIPRSHIPAVSCAGNSRVCKNLA